MFNLPEDMRMMTLRAKNKIRQKNKLKLKYHMNFKSMNYIPAYSTVSSLSRRRFSVK